MLCNNPSKSWNEYILKTRDKPIITMLKMIRKMLMLQIQTKRQMMLRAEGMLCPKIHDKLEKLIEDSRTCIVIYAGEQMFNWKGGAVRRGAAGKERFMGRGATGRGIAMGRGSSGRGSAVGRGSTGRGSAVGRSSTGRGRPVERGKTNSLSAEMGAAI
ncbi:hypothetical protein L1049_013389 [Liquidambar formosana]|uniref:Uncharacterized protein n=1 Tax=Liquidambar formosana TaxID=63359 RepID=A0AAP0RND6_LIQFO